MTTHIDEVREALEYMRDNEDSTPYWSRLADAGWTALSAHEAEVKELERDAERYRALRDKSLGTKPDFAIHVSVGHDWMRVTEIGELDSVVDAALRPFTGDEK